MIGWCSGHTTCKHMAYQPPPILHTKINLDMSPVDLQLLYLRLFIWLLHLHEISYVVGWDNYAQPKHGGKRRLKGCPVLEMVRKIRWKAKAWWELGLFSSCVHVMVRKIRERWVIRCATVPFTDVVCSSRGKKCRVDGLRSDPFNLWSCAMTRFRCFLRITFSFCLR